MIRTPVEVCEAGVAKVVGREWGPDNRFLAAGSWVYVIRFYVKDPRPGVTHSWPTNRTFLATEEELVKWQQT